MNDAWVYKLAGERRRSQRVLIGMGMVIWLETWAIIWMVVKEGL